MILYYNYNSGTVTDSSGKMLVTIFYNNRRKDCVDMAARELRQLGFSFSSLVGQWF